jgi:rhamnogalacturonyl hydrolase YesR
MTYEIPDVSAPHYAEACTALGVSRLASGLNDPSLLDLVRERWRRASTMPNTLNHVDANLIGIWAMATGEDDELALGISMADAQWEEIGEDDLTVQARYWIDDVYMIGALQAEAYRVTGEQRFIDRAALMAERYLARVQQPSGLFHHGPDAPFFWGRGNGWVAAGLAEIIAAMPTDHPRHAVVLGGFRKMADALASTQREDGLWGQLIDDPSAWSESSGSAMFAYALLRGENSGVLPPSFHAIAEQAWAGLKAKLTPQGLLSDVCVGTGQSQDASYYLERPRVTGDLHGQAPLLWLCAERLNAGV